MMWFTGVVRVTSLSLHSAIFIDVPGHHLPTCFSIPIHLIDTMFKSMNVLRRTRGLKST